MGDVPDLFAMCKQYLGGQWKDATDADFTSTILSQGFGNRLFVCELKTNGVINETIPNKVLMRIYGGNLLPKDHPHRALDETGEVLVYYALAQRKLAPELYGFFPGGRIEQYIESTQFANTDEIVPEVSAAIARIMAEFHSLRLPIKKEGLAMDRFFGKSFNDFQTTKKFIQENVKLSPTDQAFADDLFSFDFKAELDWIRQKVSSIATRVVFCHNDVNRGNMLILDDTDSTGRKLTWEERIIFIDYEFSGYDPRGADIGNHFNMRFFDFGNPKRFLTGVPYPSVEQRRFFIKEYLDRLKKKSKDFDPSFDTVDNVLKETDFYVLVLRLYNTINGLVGELSSPEKYKSVKIYDEPELSNLGLPHIFLDFYRERKQEFLNNYPDMA